MRRSRAIAYLGALCLLSAAAANAATYTIKFYEGNGNNLLEDYMLVGTGTFSVADAAVGPGALVLFEDADFLAFEATIDTSFDAPQTYTLGIDDFPDSATNPPRQGILFDGDALPRRFDAPDTAVSNAVGICDATCDVRIGLRAELTLWDHDAFDLGYVGDGTIGDVDNLMSLYPGQAITRLGGDWTQLVGSEVGGASISTHGIYEIGVTVIPVPGAAWLLASAVPLLIARLRRGSS